MNKIYDCNTKREYEVEHPKSKFYCYKQIIIRDKEGQEYPITIRKENKNE